MAAPELPVSALLGLGLGAAEVTSEGASGPDSLINLVERPASHMSFPIAVFSREPLFAHRILLLAVFASSLLLLAPFLRLVEAWCRLSLFQTRLAGAGGALSEVRTS